MQMKNLVSAEIVETDANRPSQRQRVASIDIFRGIVMIIMALDHVRDYFHYDAFLYSPTDLRYTTPFLFFTRFVTHFCAPVFVFLAGISASLYGAKRSRPALAAYLIKRGLWLVFAELILVTFGWTFNPAYPVVILQVIWAIGISIICLSALIFLPRPFILIAGIILIGGHNLLDRVNFAGDGFAAFVWSTLHRSKDFVVGGHTISVRYPVLPWIGITAIGYYFGKLYNSAYNVAKRKQILLWTGLIFIMLFVILRSVNNYGDAARWSMQKDAMFSILSFINVSKYPPSLLYTLLTLGPALIFLSVAENPLNRVTEKIIVFGRVPFFYYILHLYMLHLLALIGAVVNGYRWSTMILSDRVNNVSALKGYGFDLATVYFVWIALIFMLYPFCKWFDGCKNNHQRSKKWLTYL
jgi:uncharacterized membrane protein